eukprot:TRINITY_DN6503_c0_g1_i1.p1 TRINITY_DN6503_c0_g1~~TRINITY_DN6503_c0_g1_i1.p1  ORF type:complete len:273 (+),score=77.91 TRINITY_DN6503_c0_g1_i1:67-885(+)
MQPPVWRAALQAGRRHSSAAARGRVGGKVALVTGGGDGIGADICRALGREGAAVVVADVSAERGEAVAQEVGGSFVPCDVSKHEDVCRLFAAVVSQHGRCDLVANNAGISGASTEPTGAHPLDNWHRVIDVNLNGAFYVMREALAQMAKQGSGSLCSTASILGLIGRVGNPAYTAAKTAVVGMTKAAAVEYGPQGIRVNCVCPTVTRTPLVESWAAMSADPAAKMRQLETMNALPGMPLPRDIAEAYLWLLSDEARWVSGVALPVDGGYTAA